MTLLNQLTATHAQTLPLFDLPAADLERTYAPGKWTVRQLLVHLADAESVLHERIKRVIAEPKPVIWAFDQDRWNTYLNYSTFPLPISKAMYDANRQSVIYLVQQHYATRGTTPFVHSETGLRTLKDEMDKVAWHNEHHLNQIRQALAH
ncbi:DinB family protein [Fibrella sp. WM1]|uniref:DinB family protein n=1 Tax=Fibrella musci TaxID=3242485 RepID=UPI00351FBCBA